MGNRKKVLENCDKNNIFNYLFFKQKRAIEKCLIPHISLL